MPDIPKPQSPIRPLVIYARVPTGETCDGCHYYRARLGTCHDSTLLEPGISGIWTIATDGVRLPECLARDRNLVVTPGSPVGELVRAAAQFSADDRSVASAGLRLGVSTESLENAALAATNDPAVQAWVKKHFTPATPAPVNEAPSE